MTITKLQNLPLASLKTVLDVERVRRYVSHHGPITYMFSGSLLTDDHINVLQNLAEEKALISRLADIMGGYEVNNGLPVIHFQNRQRADRLFLEPVFGFVEDVRAGRILNGQGQAFEAIVQVGIGGCELGPRAAYHALKHVQEPRYPLHFLANIDPHHVQSVFDRIPFEKTLFVVASKSGSTLETQTSLKLIEELAIQRRIVPKDIMVAVTQRGTCLDDHDRFRQVFYIDSGVGGRFSISSAVGALPLGLVFGNTAVLDFFSGAAQQDLRTLTPDVWQNPVLLNAMMGIWERDVLRYQTLAILPYSEPLRFFGQHLQQLICESNGKTVREDRQHTDLPTSPLVVSDVGTNVQHALFQTVHQGSDVIPVQFLCVKHPVADFSQQNHRLLMASLIGQTVALANGKESTDPVKVFPGNRPSSIVALSELNAETLGALFSFYECSVILQGLFWGINSFDQEGVELGKLLTTQAMKDPDALLNAFWEHLQ